MSSKNKLLRAMNANDDPHCERSSTLINDEDIKHNVHNITCSGQQTGIQEMSGEVEYQQEEFTVCFTEILTDITLSTAGSKKMPTTAHKETQTTLVGASTTLLGFVATLDFSCFSN
jgi:hypothetical protein